MKLSNTVVHLYRKSKGRARLDEKLKKKKKKISYLWGSNSYEGWFDLIWSTKPTYESIVEVFSGKWMRSNLMIHANSAHFNCQTPWFKNLFVAFLVQIWLAQSWFPKVLCLSSSWQYGFYQTINCYKLQSKLNNSCEFHTFS